MLGVALVLIERDNNKNNLMQASEAAKRSVNLVARESAGRIAERNRQEQLNCPGCTAPRCSSSCPRYLISATHEEFFAWWGRTSPPDNKSKEVMPRGEEKKKGGSKSKKRRKKPPKHWFVNPYA